MSIFHTSVLSIGAEANLFKEERMVILFGKDAPAALADYCYMIELNPLISQIEEGQFLIIGDKQYKITCVGNVVNPNLANLGHITIKFDGSKTAELPGTLYVEQKDMPEIEIGTKILIQ